MDWRACLRFGGFWRACDVFDKYLIWRTATCGSHDSYSDRYNRLHKGCVPLCTFYLAPWQNDRRAINRDEPEYDMLHHPKVCLTVKHLVFLGMQEFKHLIVEYWTEEKKDHVRRWGEQHLEVITAWRSFMWQCRGYLSDHGLGMFYHVYSREINEALADKWPELEFRIPLSI